jgi:hypothetical protein
MRRLAILFVATTALSAVGLCPPMPVPVAGARPDIIGIDSVSEVVLAAGGPCVRCRLAPEGSIQNLHWSE